MQEAILLTANAIVEKCKLGIAMSETGVNGESVPHKHLIHLLKRTLTPCVRRHLDQAYALKSQLDLQQPKEN